MEIQANTQAENSWYGHYYEIIMSTMEDVFENKKLTCSSKQAIICSTVRLPVPRPCSKHMLSSLSARPATPAEAIQYNHSSHGSTSYLPPTVITEMEIPGEAHRIFYSATKFLIIKSQVLWENGGREREAGEARQFDRAGGGGEWSKP